MFAEWATGKITPVSVNTGIDTLDVKVATASRKQRVVGGKLVAGAAGCTVAFESRQADETATVLTGTMVLGNNAILDLSEICGIFVETVAGEKLTLNVTAGALDGVVCVQEVK